MTRQTIVFYFQFFLNLHKVFGTEGILILIFYLFLLITEIRMLKYNVIVSSI